MNSKTYKKNWEWALSNNRAIPLLENRSSNSLIIPIPRTVKKLLNEFVSFASNRCYNREITGEIAPEWLLLSESRSSHVHHFAPRWTFPVFYFRSDMSVFFSCKDGLDIGARISSINNLSKRGIEPNSNNPLFIETLVPHFEYYSTIGCRMRAIDIITPVSDYKEIEFGDARLLFFAARSFDFITMPMLLGPTNACATYLEVSLCLCELKRVLRSGGFIYIADAGFQPSIGFAAQCLDFDLFISKGSPVGLPIGTILRKRNSENQSSLFDEMFSSIDIQPLKFHHWHDEVIANCNLFFDKEPVVIY